MATTTTVDDANELIHANILSDPASEKPAFRLLVGTLALWIVFLGTTRLFKLIWFEIVTGTALAIVGVQAYGCTVSSFKLGLSRCADWFIGCDVLCTALMALALVAPVTIRLGRFTALIVRFGLVFLVHTPYAEKRHTETPMMVGLLFVVLLLLLITVLRIQHRIHAEDTNVLSRNLLVLQLVCAVDIVAVFLLALVFGNTHVLPLDLPAEWQAVIFVLSAVLITTSALEIESQHEKEPEKHVQWVGRMVVVVGLMFGIVLALVALASDWMLSTTPFLVFLSLMPMSAAGVWMLLEQMQAERAKTEEKKRKEL